jgi:hypothetical protein
MQIDPDIEAMMDAMHQAILSADFVQLQRLAPDLEAALLGLGPGSDPGAMARLQAKAQRNAQAALAAGKGVRAAIQRLEEVRQTASGLRTYDENGRRPTQTGGGELSQRL